MKQLKTRWADFIQKNAVLSEYPRPCLIRKHWQNLNGSWDYAITNKNIYPKQFPLKILVPFSPECALSGVNHKLQPNEFAWYHRRFSLQKYPSSERLFLHFGAVDQFCEVYINYKRVGNHIGGYTPFHFDITSFVQQGENDILIKVRDFSDTSFYSRGKQKRNPSGMFYTAQSGIWQTVWLEPVPLNFIERITFTPDFDHKIVRIYAKTLKKIPISCTISGNGISSFTIHFFSNTQKEVLLPTLYPWTPETPYLYQVEFNTASDQVFSYFAMRKCDIQTDPSGIRRLYLNNQPYFHAGVLDQGYWPESLYTPPTDQALIFDIQLAKSLGFNMIRKHAKVDSDRFYYHCDRLGMLVWQDIVNGGTSYHHLFVTYFASLIQMKNLAFSDKKRHAALLSRKEATGRHQYIQELKETIHALSCHPSIVVWVPFNEGWGQFSSARITSFIRHLDPTRLIDHASGWFDQGCGDFKSIHYYFFHLKFHREPFRALAITEFGGYSLHIKGHSACPPVRVYGYKRFSQKKSLRSSYKELIQNIILPAVHNGVSATVLTQLTDIEEEVNGICTYDRKILKFDKKETRHLNQCLKNAIHRIN